MDFKNYLNKEVKRKDGKTGFIEKVIQDKKFFVKYSDNTMGEFSNNAFEEGRLFFIKDSDKDYINDIIKSEKEAEEERLRLNSERARVANEERERIAERLKYKRCNAAYKANYCDDGIHEWFTMPCSKERREKNCNDRDGWCRNGSVCKKVIDGKMEEERIREEFESGFLCYECKIFSDWSIKAGRSRFDQAYDWSLRKDRLLVLTTADSDNLEEERMIIGAFLINNSYPKDEKNNKEAYATSYEQYRLKLTKEESAKIKFWNYYSYENTDSIKWGTRLLRYFDDAIGSRILKDMVDVICESNRTEIEKNNARSFLNKFLNDISLNEDDIPEKSGTLTRIK